jgi:hypothetical protein
MKKGYFLQQAILKQLNIIHKVINLDPHVILSKNHLSWVPVAHVYNPSYLRSRNLEDCCSKAVGANTVSQKYSSQKRTCGVAECVSPEFKPQYYLKK